GDGMPDMDPQRWERADRGPRAARGRRPEPCYEGGGARPPMSDEPGRLTYIAPVLRAVDSERSLAFYRDRLGVELHLCYEEFCASVSRDGGHIHLQCARPTPRDQDDFERSESIDAGVVVQNAAELSATFTSAGVTLAVPLRRMPYGVEFYVRDPDGYV